MLKSIRFVFSIRRLKSLQR